MTHLLAVDPGIRHCGVALFQDGLLVRAALKRNPVAKGDDARACVAMACTVLGWAQAWAAAPVVVCERMQVYAPGQQKGDPADLITLAIVAGALQPHVLYLPREWKGQIPKPAKRSEVYALETRVRSRLNPDELAALPDDVGPAWDVIDAVGIGLHHLGRLAPRRVIVR